ncbi:MAG: MBL fold metallo-hydrolase [Anaerolineae bacterium]
MLLKFWGVRGSIPAPVSPLRVRDKVSTVLREAVKHGINLADQQAINRFLAALPQGIVSTVGGNTTCITAETDQGLIIFDAGSGMRELGAHLMAREFGQGKGHATIFFTHTHWDHIQGLPFFTPIYVPGNTFDVYHVHPYVPEVLRQQMTFRVFPALFDDLPSTLRFHRISEGEQVEVAGVKISNIELQHPGKAYAYRIESEQADIVLATDGEYKKLDASHTKRYIDFYAKADVLIFDAQFSVRDSIIREDWGHSSALIGADIGREAQVRRLVLFHHDPTSTDEEIMAVLEATNEYLAQDSGKSPMEVIVAQEGMEIDLRPALSFGIEEHIVGDTVHLALNGRFGAQATEEFRHHLEHSLQNYDTDKVILIMRDLNELTVAGIRALLDVRKNAFSMAIVELPEKIYRVLELSGTTDFFAIYENVDAAMNALAGNNAHTRQNVSH